LASREVFWNIPYGYVIYVLAAIALTFWAFGFYRRYQLWHLGKPDDSSKNIGKRIPVFIRTTLVDVLAHRRFLRDPYPGMMHLIIFWGFIILLLASAVDAVTHYIIGHIIGTPYLWFKLIVNIGGLLALAGIIMAAYRRYVSKPKRLNTLLDDGIGMALIAAMLITGFMVEGLRQAATELTLHPDWAVWSAGGFLVAKAFADMSQSSLLFWHWSLWWFHSVLALAAIIYSGLVFSKLQHVVVSPLNIFFRSLGPVGSPAPIDIENAETLGAATIKDFTWKHLLDLDACTNCGRCQDACPAWATGKPLSPRKVVQDLKVHMLKAANNQANQSDSAPTLVGEAPSEAEIWACTTCAACQETCPVYVEHIVKIIDLRRNLVLAQSKMPETAQLMLRNMQSRGHPWAGVQSLRLRGDWTSGLELKILAEGDSANTLFWVGCTGALVERNVAATLSMTRVLKAAGVDFAVLAKSRPAAATRHEEQAMSFSSRSWRSKILKFSKTTRLKRLSPPVPTAIIPLRTSTPGTAAISKWFTIPS